MIFFRGFSRLVRLGWDVVMQMYDALVRIGDKNSGGPGVDDAKFARFATLYHQSIDRLTLQVKDKYEMLRDELKHEEDNLMELLERA